MRNKLISILVLVALCLTACTTDKPSADTEPPAPEELYEYIEVSGGIQLTKYLGTETEITVPETIENKKVISTGITFSGNITIEKVILPASVKEADFAGCERLTYLYAPGICSLSKLKLEGCTSLKELNVAELPTTINPSSDWDSLNSLEIVHIDGVAHFTMYHYNFPSSLKELSVKSAETIYIGYHGWGCKLESVTISEKIKYYTFDSDVNRPGELCAEENDRTIEITEENAAYVYCSIFRTDSIVVNGVKYEYQYGQ